MTAIQDQIFHQLQADWTKLAAYGFKGAGTDWTYRTALVHNFILTVTIHDTAMTTAVTDADAHTPYVLHLDPANTGTFVGEVRQSYVAALKDIARGCFKRATFASGQSAAIVAALAAEYGDKLEFLWQKFPNNAIIRRADNRKWYALLVRISASKVGLPGDHLTDVLVVRADAATITAKLKAHTALPAYHMNKQHWLSYQLNAAHHMADLMTAIADSRELAQ